MSPFNTTPWGRSSRIKGTTRSQRTDLSSNGNWTSFSTTHCWWVIVRLSRPRLSFRSFVRLAIALAPFTHLSRRQTKTTRTPLPRAPVRQRFGASRQNSRGSRRAPPATRGRIEPAHEIALARPDTSAVSRLPFSSSSSVRWCAVNVGPTRRSYESRRAGADLDGLKHVTVPVDIQAFFAENRDGAVRAPPTQEPERSDQVFR